MDSHKIGVITYYNFDGFDCHLRVPFVFGVTNPIIKELSFICIPLIYELLKKITHF